MFKIYFCSFFLEDFVDNDLEKKSISSCLGYVHFYVAFLKAPSVLCKTDRSI